MTKKPKPEATKKPKSKAAPAAEPEAAGRTIAMINEKALKGLLKAKRATAAEVDEINGGYRSKLAFAVEKQHLHKKAYATVVQMDRMAAGSLEKLAEYWDVLNAYMDMSGLMKKIESVGRLDLGDGAETDDDETGEADPAPNVARPQFGGAKGDDHIKKQVDALRGNAGASPSASAAE